MPCKNKRAIKGSALISVLLLTAVLAALGAASLTLAEGRARRATARRGIDRAYYAAEGAVLIAAERIALNASMYGGAPGDGGGLPAQAEVRFYAPYMETAMVHVSAENIAGGIRVTAHAAAAGGECAVILETDGSGAAVRLNAVR